MGERNVGGPIWTFPRNFLFSLLMITSLMFILSWFFVLRSAGWSSEIRVGSLLPNLKTSNGDTEIGSLGSEGDSLSEKNKQSVVGRQEEEEEEEDGGVREEVVGFRKRNGGSIRCEGNTMDVLRVYMYDLPPEFHFGLLDWEPQGKSVWPDIRGKVPDYPGGLNWQHSIEYWLTLDLLASELPVRPNAGSAVRVRNSSEADVIFVPFFASLSYNRYSRVNPHEKKSKNKLLQEKLVNFLTNQNEWKRNGGRDHVIVAHHPNSLLDARMQLWPSMFILSDFGRYPPTIANMDKDIIAPYKHVVKSFANDTAEFDSRPTLLYFQGAIYRKDGGLIRQELFYRLKDEKDVHFSFGSAQKGGVSQATLGMHSSKFCLNIAGDTPSSNRLFDAIASHCVPVIISDDIELPYEDILNYSEFCIFVRTSDALKEKFLVNMIRDIGREDWTKMWRRLKEIENMYEFQYPSKEGDGVQMIWQAISRKVPAIRQRIHKSRRFSPYASHKTGDLTSIMLPNNFW